MDLKPKYSVAVDENHKYTIAGKPVVGVTSILRNSGYMPDFECDQYYLDRGTYIHRACELYRKGTLDMDSVSDALRGYLAGYIAWCEQYKPRLVLSEVPVGSRLHGFGGRPDEVDEIDGELWLVDMKSGSKSITHKWQTAGYAEALTEQYGLKIRKRAALYLTEDGKYKVDPHTDVADRSEFLVFAGKLKIDLKYKGDKIK